MSFHPETRSVKELMERSLVVDEARTWVGTPWHHMGDVKGVGVDCAMLPVRVYTDTGLIPDLIDPRPYPRDWALHRSEELYLTNVERMSREIAEHQAGPGDLVVWRWGRTFSHGGIIVDWRKKICIQALAKERLVIEGPPPGYLTAGRPIKFYSYWWETAQ